MKIRKVAQSVGVLGKILNLFSNSNKDTYSCDYLNNNDNYTISEIKTNKRWVDGKPIYRKCFITSSPANAGSDAVIINNSSISPNIEQVTMLDGVFTEMNARFSINSWYSEQYYVSSYWNPSDGFRMKVGPQMLSRACVIVLEYTKTTD